MGTGITSEIGNRRDVLQVLEAAEHLEEESGKKEAEDGGKLQAFEERDDDHCGKGRVRVRGGRHVRLASKGGVHVTESARRRAGDRQAETRIGPCNAMVLGAPAVRRKIRDIREERANG